MDWIVADGLGIITGFNAQAPGAKSFIKNVMKHNPNANIFITGHSLGGNLAYNAASKAIDINREAVVKVNTYNGFGLLLGLSLGLTDLVDEQRLMSQREKITDYVVEGDPVYNLWFTFHYGTKELFTQSDGAKDAHSLYTFFDKLPPFDRTNRY